MILLLKGVHTLASSRLRLEPWSELSWTRWGFALALVSIAAFLELWLPWHRGQYLPSSYFLPEYGWRSRVPLPASWPTVVAEAACYVQLGWWFWVGWTMGERRRLWWPIIGSQAIDLALVVITLAMAVWGRDLMMGHGSPALGVMPRHLARWGVDAIALGLMGEMCLLIGWGMAFLVRGTRPQKRTLIGVWWFLGIALAARLCHNAWVPIVYQQMDRAGVLPPNAPSAFIPFISPSAPMFLGICSVTVVLLGWWLVKPELGVGVWRQNFSFLLGAWCIFMAGFWLHLRPTDVYAAQHQVGITGSAVALSMVDATLMIVPTFFLCGLLGPSLPERRGRMRTLSALSVGIGVGLVVVAVVSGLFTVLAEGHWPYGAQGQQAAWIGAVYALIAVESLMVAQWALGLLANPIVAACPKRWQRRGVAGLGFFVDLLAISVVQQWWIPFFRQVNWVTEINGLTLGGVDIIAVPVVTLAKYVVFAGIVVAVLVVSTTRSSRPALVPKAAAGPSLE